MNQPRSQAGVIWIAAAGIVIAMVVTGFLIEGGPFAWILAGMTLLFAMGSTAVTVGGSVAARSRDAAAQHRDDARPDESPRSKAKRGDNMTDMLTLLSDEDIEELRERIKRRLIDQIDSGSFEDVESFEALLASRDRLKRK